MRDTLRAGLLSSMHAIFCSVPEPADVRWRLPATQVLCITLGVCVATWAFVFVALLLMAPYLPMTAGLTPNQTFGVISLAATLMMARSPASMVIILAPPLAHTYPSILTPFPAHCPQVMLLCDATTS